MNLSDEVLRELSRSRQRTLHQEAAHRRLCKQAEEQNRSRSATHEIGTRPMNRLTVPAAVTVAALTFLLIALAYITAV